MILINFTCVIKRKVKHDRCTHVKSSKKDSLRHRHNTVIDSEIEGSSALNWFDIKRVKKKFHFYFHSNIRKKSIENKTIKKKSSTPISLNMSRVRIQWIQLKRANKINKNKKKDEIKWSDSK